MAELAPPGLGSTETALRHGLLALAGRGLLTLGAAATPGLYPAFRGTRRRQCAAELLDDERGSR